MSNLQFNFFHNIIFVGIATGVLLGILLLSTPKFRKRTNTLLAIFLLSFYLNNLYYFIIDINLNEHFPILNFLPISLKTLIPVAAYLYILLTIHPDQKLGIKHWLLFLPPTIQFAFYSFLAVLYCFSSKILMTGFSTIESMYRLDELLSIIFAITLTIAIIIRIRMCRKNQQCKREHLRWVIQFLLLGVTAMLLWIFPFIYLYITKSYQISAFYPMWSFSSVLVCWIGTQGFKQPNFFEKDIPKKEKTEKLSISPEDRQRSKLREIMLADKPHKNPELSIKDLADLLGISVNKLRKMIQTKEGNYHNFINHYRVKEAKELLTNPKNSHFTIEAIGEMAGFRSRATFFSSFKQNTGKTPQQYKHEHLKTYRHKSE